jgi:hypothetical protein
MKKISLFFFLFCTFFSFSQELDWKGGLGGSDSDSAVSLCYDLAGNIYTTGLFYSQIDLNQGSKVSEISSSGQSDIFIQKTDPFGRFVWGKRIGGTGFDKITDLKIDNNYLYISGQFESEVNFDQTKVVSNGLQDAFIAKIDTSGNVVWVKTYGGSSNDKIDAIVVKNDNLSFVGTFSGNILGQTTDNSMLIHKMRSADGAEVWSKSIGKQSSVKGNTIGYDSLGVTYVSGAFIGANIDFNSSLAKDSILSSEKKSGTSLYTQDAFILKLKENGDFLFVKKIGGSIDNEIINSSFVRGNKFAITGYFSGSVNFGNKDSKSITSNGKEDVFVALYDLSLDLKWVKNVGGLKTDFGKSIYLDSLFNVYATGTFFDSDGKGVDFDPSASTSRLYSSNSNNAFIWKLDQFGNYKLGLSFGGAKNDNGVFISSNNDQEIFSIGNFESTGTFVDSTIVSAGKSDVYVIKTVLGLERTFVIDYALPGLDPNALPFQLEVYVKDIDNLPWFNNAYLTTASQDKDGENNSILVENVQGTGIPYAVKACNDFVLKKKNDWFLPSIEELELMYQKRSKLGGFKNVNYWSSSEKDNNNAIVLNFTEGVRNNIDKSVKAYVRPVRKKFKGDLVVESQIKFFDIYPNPALDILTVRLIENYSQYKTVVKIYSISGEKVLEKEMSSIENNFDLSNFKTGVYIISVENEMMIYREKITKE